MKNANHPPRSPMVRLASELRVFERQAAGRGRSFGNNENSADRANHMAQPGRYGGRGGSRGRRPARSGRGSLVWTPGSAGVRTPPAGATAAPTAETSVAPVPASSPTTPALKARTSTRKAADLVQVVSEQSAAEIELHLKEVEDRLAVVIAQEEEVRAIADEHVERESHLTKLLEDLYRQQKEELQGPSRQASSSLASSAGPLLEKVAEATGASDGDRRAAAAVPATSSSSSSAAAAAAAAAASTAAATSSTAGPAVQDAVSQQSLPRPDAAPSLPQPARNVRAAAGTLTSTQTGGSAQARRRHASSIIPGGSGSSEAIAAGGKDPDPNLVLAMAMGCSVMPGGYDFLTRDAVTIAEYIGLMSHEAVAEDAGWTAATAERWPQPGLSLKDILDRAEATAACPARMPNLLALAEAIRPLNGNVFAATVGATAAGLPSARGSNNQGQKRKAGGGILPSASDDALNDPSLMTTSMAADAQAKETEAMGSKRRRVDVSAILCPFELNGVCNDDDCRYQHLDIYLRTPSKKPSKKQSKKQSKKSSTSLPQVAAMAPNTTSASATVSDPSAPGKAGAASDETAVESTQRQQHQLPAIDFSGELEPPRQAAPEGDRVGWRGAANATPPTKPSKRQAVSPARAATGGGGEDAIEEGGESGEETTSVDGEEDFLALPTESAECERGEGGGGAADEERASELAADERPSPAVLAEAFARAASGESTKGGHGRGGGGGATGVGGNSSGGVEARYYFEDGSRKARGAAVTALTGEQLTALEVQLNKDASCHVEGWLLLALHRLPRAGNSATAVLDTVVDVARSTNRPMSSFDQAAIKSALRTFVQPLERAEGGQAEALWLLYLRLFAFLPGKSNVALGMAEYALRKFPTSRRIWRLYLSMSQKSSGWSLTKETLCYTRQIEALLILRSRADDAAALRPQPQDGSGSSVSSSRSTGARETGPGTAERGDGGGSKIVEMIIFLVLERCCLLAESGYKLQAAAETLDALGALTEGQPLWGWDATHEQGRRTVLRAPSGGDSCDGEGSPGGASGASAAGDGQRLPPGIATAVKEAPRESRCVLWLTALHLLKAGVFPRHALLIAENCGGGDVDDDGGAGTNPREDTRDLAHLLLWPKEWLSSKSSSGLELPVNAELQEVIFKTFMNALSDAELLPPKSRGGQGWAPPTKDRNALLSSPAEAKTARTRGLAPDPSALEGTPLVLALNWLTFCRGRADAKQGRMMAVACCRRFQLARPDHPALLEHFLLEHQVSKARTLEDIHDEISRAFDPKGVAAEALRERREAAEGKTALNPTYTDDGKSEPPVPSSPSEGRLQAVYTFFRFVEMRLETAGSNSATPAGHETVEVARSVLHKALVGMWTAASASAPNARRSDTPGWPQEEGDEPLRQAFEGAKASLFRWADGGSESEAELSAGASSRQPGVRRRCRRRDVPGRNGERQLSTIVFSLWVLGGASAAIRALDHLLSAESFSHMSAERRRLAWLQRLGAAVVLSTQQAKLPGEDSLQAVREVALRALADHRTHRRAEYATLAHFVASTLDRPFADSGSSRGLGSIQSGRYDPASVAAETPVASFSHDILTVYANHFRRITEGVDWVVAAEALERGGGGGEDGRLAALSLLRWVSWADKDGPAYRSTGGILGIQTNARPYVDKALTRHPTDPDLSSAVAALAAATRLPGHAQRVLEAALRANPFCAALWRQRVALEAGFGCGSTERAGVIAAAAASSNALVRLSCGGKIGGDNPNKSGQTRTAGRIATTVSHPLSRRETKSFSLQAALSGPPQEAAAAHVTAVVPRSVFLMKSLISLSLAFNRLVSVPAAIWRLSGLRSLDVSGNALTALPLSLSRLSGTLRVLRAAGNKISTLSGGPVGYLVGLRVLDLERNELSEFPEAVVGRLGELRTLKLAGNGFCERAPAGLSDVLPHLEELTLPARS